MITLSTIQQREKEITKNLSKTKNKMLVNLYKGRLFELNELKKLL